MINELKALDVYTLPKLVNFISGHRNFSFWLSSNNLGPVKRDSGFGTIYFESLNEVFSVFGIYHKDDIIEDFFLSGKFDLSISELVELYGKPREAYSRYDNEYVFFFNERNSLSAVVSCRMKEPIGSANGIQVNNLRLSWTHSCN